MILNLNSKRGWATQICFFVVGLSVVFPRLMVCLGLPGTDEGVYAYFSQMIHASLTNGLKIPGVGGLKLYPIFVSWVFQLPLNHLIALRLVDFCVACLAGILLFEILREESKSKAVAVLISVIFLFTINQPLFIQSGFKNSMFAAFIPLFLAFRIFQQAELIFEKKALLLIGGLTTLSVLLRETFIPFFLVGFFFILLCQGFRALLAYCFGSLLVSLIIFSILSYLHGDLLTILTSYSNMTKIYTAMDNHRYSLFASNGRASLVEAQLAVTIALVFCVSTLLVLCKKMLSIPYRLFFWIIVALVPLIEPALKMGFPYHFSVSLLGLAGLSAFCYQLLTSQIEQKQFKSIIQLALFLCLGLLVPKAKNLIGYGLSNLKNVNLKDELSWSDTAKAQSNYLIAAEIIKNHSSNNSSLGVSGFMFALYPITGLLPRSVRLRDLTILFLEVGLDEEKLTRELLDGPPDILMSTKRTDFPGVELIDEAILKTGLYQEIAEVPVDPTKAYGLFGGTIYNLSRNKIP